MVGTRSTRSTRSRPLPTDEITPAELPASPKRSQRKKRLSKVETADLLVAENGEAGRATSWLGGAGDDNMKLDTEQVDDTKTGEAGTAIGGTAIGKTDITMEAPPSVANDAPVDGAAVETVTLGDALAPIGDHEFAAGLSEVEIRRSGRKRVAPTILDEVAGKAVKTKAGAQVSAWKAADNNNNNNDDDNDDDDGDGDDDDDDDDDMDDVDEDSEWEEEYLMTNPDSVYATNLQDFFNPSVWSKFTSSEQAHLLRFLPECDKVYPPSTNVSDDTTPQATLIDDFWDNPQLLMRISHVEADIAEGKYTPANQAAIVEARKRSEAGEFNEFKDNKFEQFWGQKQRVNYEAVAGDTREVKITTLAKHQVLRVGDVFSLRRTFGKTKGIGKTKGAGKTKGGGVTVEKDAKLIAIDPIDFSLTFSYPPDKLQVSSDSKPDKIIPNVVSIGALETLLCKEDGRAPSKLPNGNAFKTFRIRRNEQDIGSLFDVRMEFHAKYISPKAD